MRESLVFRCRVIALQDGSQDLAHLNGVQVQLLAPALSVSVHRHLCGDGAHQFLIATLEFLARQGQQAQSQQEW